MCGAPGWHAKFGGQYMRFRGDVPPPISPDSRRAFNIGTSRGKYR